MAPHIFGRAAGSASRRGGSEKSHMVVFLGDGAQGVPAANLFMPGPISRARIASPKRKNAQVWARRSSKTHSTTTPRSTHASATGMNRR